MNKDNDKNTHRSISDNSELPIEKDYSVPSNIREDFSGAKSVHIYGKNPTLINRAEHVNYSNNISVTDQDLNRILNSIRDFARKNISKKKIILSVFLICILFVTLFVLTGKYKNFKSFEASLELAESDMNSGNYIDAAKEYHYAASIAPSKDGYVQATCMEANAYMVLGIVSDEKRSDLYESYYDKAIKLYYQIISNSKYSNAEFYYDAAAGLSNCYLFLDYPLDDYRWKSAVGIMEGYVEGITSKSGYMQTFNVYLALSLYYEKLTKSSQDNMINVEYQAKALEYSSIVSELAPYMQYQIGTNALTYDIGTVSMMLDRTIMYSVSIGEPYDYIPDVIKKCISIIEEVNNSDCYIDHYSYHSINYVLGKACVYMGMIDKSGNRQAYYENAYNAFAPFLKDDGSISEVELLNTAYYCVLTGLCSGEDIINIVNILKKADTKIFSETLTTDSLHQAVLILSIYCIISSIYDYDDDLINEANSLVDRIRTYNYLLSLRDKNELDGLSAYFSGVNGKDESPYADLIEYMLESQ